MQQKAIITMSAMLAILFYASTIHAQNTVKQVFTKNPTETVTVNYDESNQPLRLDSGSDEADDFQLKSSCWPPSSCNTADLIFLDCGTLSQNGNTVNISGVEILNVGSAPAGHSKVGWYLSTDDNISTDDYLLAVGNMPVLYAYYYVQFSDFTLNLDHIPSGNYYLGTIIDYENSVAEFNEENNIGCVSHIATTATLPDLEITCDTSYYIDTDYFLDINVSNTGGTAADASVLEIYLSIDNIIDANDYSLAMINIFALDPDASALVQFSINTANLPDVPPGNYYIGVVADTNNDVVEDDEENNVGCISPSADITIPTLPDLEITCDASYYIGTDYFLDINVSNTGGTASDESVLEIYLSTDNIIDGSDYSLAMINIFALDPDASSLVQFSVNTANLPDVPPGNYYIGVVADANNDVVEDDEENNIGCVSPSADITIPTLPDLEITCDTSYYIGTDYFLDITVANTGGTASDASVLEVYLSTDNVIDASDYSLAMINIFALDPDASSLVQFSVNTANLPDVPPGNYYIGAVADINNDVVEDDQENNIGCVSPSADVTVTAFPDFAITNCDTMTSSGTLRFFNNIVITNVGGIASSQSNVGIFLSADSDVSTSDYLVAEVDIPALNPGSSTIRNLSFDTADTSVPPGNYYIGIVADTDNDVMEDDEENNVGCVSPSADITITASPDFAITNCDTMTSSGTLRFFNNIVITNVGGITSSQSNVGIFLSTDSDVSTSDYLVAEVDIPALSPGSSVIRNLSFDTADTSIPPGNYYIGIVADTDNDVMEDDEENNVGCVSSAASIIICQETPGTSCDDGDGCTANDTYDEDCVCTGTPIPYCGTCRYTDSLALVALYNSTDGVNWTETWDLTQPITTWENIYIQEGCVIVIDLPGNNLNGNLPEEIGDMINLQFLDLNFNNLSGSIPSSIGNLDKLIYFRLRDNNLSGNIPSSIGGMTNLRNLWLYNNQLSGSIPPEIDSLDNLELLQLSFNNLTGSIPSTIGRMESIRGIYIDENNLSGSIPVMLGDLITLEALSLSSNNLTDTIPSELGMLDNLIYLNLGYNNLEGNIPTELGNISGLRELYLSNNALTGSIPSTLGSISTLRSLRLNNNDLSGCYDANLSNWCTQLSIGSNTDSAINAGNQGLSSWEDFCNNQSGICQAAPKIGGTYISGYNIYPNPIQNRTTLNLEFNSHTDSEDATLSVYNLTGQLTQSENLTIQNGKNHFTTTLKNYAAGIYFVKLQSGTYVGTQKLVIQ